MSRKAMTKEAGGLVIYLLEELGDSRVQCSRLKKFIKEAVDLIEKSDQRDQFFEIAGHLLHGVPEALMKLEKALDAAAMAGARLDYEEIKQTLRPEKADELEDVMEDIRLRYLKPKRSEDSSMTTPKQAAEALLAIADQTEKSGQVPVGEVQSLIASLETSKTASDVKAKAETLRKFARDLQKKANRADLIRGLRQVVAAEFAPVACDPVAADPVAQEELTSRFEEGKPADPTEDMSPEDKKEWWEHHEEHKDNFKEAASVTKAELERALKMDEAMLANVRSDIKKMGDGEQVNNLTLPNAKQIEASLEQVIANKKKLLSKFKEASQKPARTSADWKA